MSPDSFPTEVATFETKHGPGSIVDVDVKTHPLTTLEAMAGPLGITAYTFRTYVETGYGAGFRDVNSQRVRVDAAFRSRASDIIEGAEDDGHDVVVDSLVITDKAGFGGGLPQKVHLGMIDFSVDAKTVSVDQLIESLSHSEDSEN